LLNSIALRKEVISNKSKLKGVSGGVNLSGAAIVIIIVLLPVLQ
jgi:hypothetical protein